METMCNIRLFLFFLYVILPIPLQAHVPVEENIPCDRAISIIQDGFIEPNQTITAGSYICFINNDAVDHWPASNVHPTHDDYPEFDPQKPISPGDSWAFHFDKSGRWEFHDHLFPGMTGVIEVQKTPSKFSISGIVQSFKKMFALFSSLFKKDSYIASTTKNDTSNIIKKKSSEPEEALPNTAGIKTEFIPPPKKMPNGFIENFKNACEGNNSICFIGEMRNITKEYGPMGTSELVMRLKQTGVISPHVDEHQLSHQIGRQTAESFGINSESFLLCPMSLFNGGCQHGFFEHVLGQTESSKEAADLICKALDPEKYSSKDIFYCYHGVGHGVMMAKAYDLTASLSVCDSLGEPYATDGCWQGVFMENTNGALTGNSRKDVFSFSDPLLPCSSLEKKYRHECYINHAGWLMQVHGNSIKKASHECLNADDKNKSVCLQSLGLMVTNPSWQPNILETPKSASHEEKAWTLCTHFPDGYERECVIGAIDNIANFDQLDTKRASRFCLLVDKKLQNVCYKTVGANIQRQSVKEEDARTACNTLPQNAADLCREGANI